MLKRFLLVVYALQTTISLLLADPEIDLMDFNDVETLPDHCNNKQCPRYTLGNDVNLPNSIGVRDYVETYWVSTSRYYPTANSCLEGDMMLRYYQELYNFYKGVNTMGLLIDRTLPIRIIGRMDENATLIYCHAMFYIPEMYALNPPAPLSVDVFVGYNWSKRCYSLSAKGAVSWRRAMRLYKALKKFLIRKNIPNIDNSDMLVDIYSGYGVPNSQKYGEVLVCDHNQ